MGTVHHTLLGHVLGAELILIFPLILAATTGRRASLLLSSSVSLEESLHNPRSPLILVVDLLLPGASHPGHLAI
jgi:hypothetical protein